MDRTELEKLKLEKLRGGLLEYLHHVSFGMERAAQDMMKEYPKNFEKGAAELKRLIDDAEQVHLEVQGVEAQLRRIGDG